MQTTPQPKGRPMTPWSPEMLIHHNMLGHTRQDRTFPGATWLAPWTAGQSGLPSEGRGDVLDPWRSHRQKIPICKPDSSPGSLL